MTNRKVRKWSEPILICRLCMPAYIYIRQSAGRVFPTGQIENPFTDSKQQLHREGQIVGMPFNSVVT